jgi:RNA polymerase sigma-70 factor (ECF subfamily)
MVDDEALNRWFCDEVLPLEHALNAFVRNNWRSVDDVSDLRQEIYERVLIGARSVLPGHARAYLFTVARNHLINKAKRNSIVSMDLIADLEQLEMPADFFAAHRHLAARDELRRAQAGLDRLPAKCREVVRLRKVEGLTIQETAEKTGVTAATIERQLVHGMRALVDHMLGGSGKLRRDAPKPRAAEYKYEQ